MTAAALDPAGPLPIAFSDPRGEGKPILFVHGFSHNGAVWEKLADGLPASLRPLLVDLRGHGASPWSPEGAYGLDDYADDLELLLDRLGLASVHVVAHSLGGNVATLLAARIPDRIASLTLVDTGPSLRLDGSAQVQGDVDASLGRFDRVGVLREQLGQIHPRGDGEILDRLAEASAVRALDGRFEWALDPGVLGSQDADSDAAALEGLEERLWAALAALRCPVLVVRGEVSAILDESVARRMIDDVLEDGHLETIPGAGHAVMIDDGPALLRHLERFLTDVRDAPQPR
jgi:pimeloyl-ACP methyl ester carboxylesterase